MATSAFSIPDLADLLLQHKADFEHLRAQAFVVLIGGIGGILLLASLGFLAYFQLTSSHRHVEKLHSQ